MKNHQQQTKDNWRKKKNETSFLFGFGPTFSLLSNQCIIGLRGNVCWLKPLYSHFTGTLNENKM